MVTVNSRGARLWGLTHGDGHETSGVQPSRCAHLELRARSCRASGGRSLDTQSRGGVCEWEALGWQAEAEVESGWAAGGRCRALGIGSGLSALCRQHPRTIRNSPVKPGFAGCREAMFIQVGGCNMFYLTVCNLICNI